MANILYIAAKKIEDGVLVIKNKIQQALEKFFRLALNFLRKVADRFSHKEGRVYKGQRHSYTKKNGQTRERSVIVHLDQELGAYEKTEVTVPVPEENIPPQYRDLKEFEICDDTEELNAVLG